MAHVGDKVMLRGTVMEVIDDMPSGGKFIRVEVFGFREHQELLNPKADMSVLRFWTKESDHQPPTLKDT